MRIGGTHPFVQLIPVQLPDCYARFGQFAFRLFPRIRFIKVQTAVGDVAGAAGGFVFGARELLVAVSQLPHYGGIGVVEYVDCWCSHGIGLSQRAQQDEPDRFPRNLDDWDAARSYPQK